MYSCGFLFLALASPQWQFFPALLARGRVQELFSARILVQTKAGHPSPPCLLALLSFLFGLFGHKPRLLPIKVGPPHGVWHSISASLRLASWLSVFDNYRGSI